MWQEVKYLRQRGPQAWLETEIMRRISFTYIIQNWFNLIQPWFNSYNLRGLRTESFVARAEEEWLTQSRATAESVKSWSCKCLFAAPEKAVPKAFQIFSTFFNFRARWDSLCWQRSSLRKILAWKPTKTRWKTKPKKLEEDEFVEEEEEEEFKPVPTTQGLHILNCS